MTLNARIAIIKGTFHLDVVLQCDISGVTAVIGPSGCGKTSMLRAIAGFERNGQCEISVNQQVWQNASRYVPVYRRPVGYVFQEAQLFSHLCVRDNIEFGFKRTRESNVKISPDAVINALGLEYLLSRMPQTLSGGEKQRVAIARAVLAGPQLLLMDEPLSALDSQSKQALFPFIETLHTEFNIPILYVSHSIHEVARLANHVVVMQAGKIAAQGPCQDILARMDLPLAHSGEAESMLEAAVVSHDDYYQLTQLACSAGRLWVPRVNKSPGEPVRVQILARDVSITLQQSSDTSILNCFAATVEQIAQENPAQVTIKLNAGGVPILSRITRKSVDSLGLQPGFNVYAQVKSVAVMA